jgi:hypothetical protein
MRLFLALTLAAAIAACSPAPTPAPAADNAVVADIAVVGAPAANARVASPLAVTGTAPANWYFENQFPVRLLDAQCVEIAFAPANPRVNWTENAEPKQFDAELSFNVQSETAATLVLQEDMPREGETPREVRIPVTLLPSR